MYGSDILWGILKGTFEIPHKISYPYVERCSFYPRVKLQGLLDLRAHKCFGTPQEEGGGRGKEEAQAKKDEDHNCDDNNAKSGIDDCVDDGD